MLGVRRTSVSGNANKLQEEGLISYKRGVIKVLDRKALEKSSCECYAAVRGAIADAMPR
jgi:Mn-dependent DtxR family transcriptional regulator